MRRHSGPYAHQNTDKLLMSLASSLNDTRMAVAKSLDEFNATFSEQLATMPESQCQNDEILEAIDEAIGNIYQNNERVSILTTSVTSLSDSIRASGGLKKGPNTGGKIVSIAPHHIPPAQTTVQFPRDVRDDIKFVRKIVADLLRL